MASGGVTSGLGIHAVGSGSYGLAADYHDVLFSINRDPCDPLLVELEYFRGTVTKRGVRLDWKTTFELEHAGFRILRHAGDDPEKNVVFEVLTDELIHGRGDELVGAEYEFLDTSKGLAGTVTYYLEDIDIFGVRTLHDPIVIEIPDGRRKGDRARK